SVSILIPPSVVAINIRSPLHGRFRGRRAFNPKAWPLQGAAKLPLQKRVRAFRRSFRRRIIYARNIRLARNLRVVSYSGGTFVALHSIIALHAALEQDARGRSRAGRAIVETQRGTPQCRHQHEDLVSTGRLTDRIGPSRGGGTRQDAFPVVASRSA